VMADDADEDAARAEALNGPMRRFRAGEITAQQADALWDAAGVLPYPVALPGGVPTASWTLPLAVAWIATRRADLMEAVALRSAFWGERVAHEPAGDGSIMDLGTARSQLEEALRRGDLEAQGKGVEGNGRREAVPRFDIDDLAVGLADGSVLFDVGLRSFAPPMWVDVRLEAAAIQRLWPSDAPEPGASVTSVQPTVVAPPGLPESAAETSTTPVSAQLSQSPVFSRPETAQASTSSRGKRQPDLLTEASRVLSTLYKRRPIENAKAVIQRIKAEQGVVVSRSTLDRAYAQLGWIARR